MISPLDVDGLRQRVQQIINDVIAEQTSVLAEVGEELEPMLAAVTELLAGGKRLRPAFCYWGYRAVSADSTQLDAVMSAAASLEFLQACALIHDDVMDGSDTRRGMPAAHRRFAVEHAQAQWHGSAESFGLGAAILLGDLCLSWADEVLWNCGLPLSALAAAKSVYDVMRTELMAGQYLDLLEQARGGGSVERSMRVVRYKSAKYTIERPLHLGATLAGADPATLKVLSQYGLPLGEAFQLRDDVLGVFGDPEQTGKPAGDDLREGKRTVLLAMAMRDATPDQKLVLDAHLGRPDLDADGVSALRSVIVDTGALANTELLIEEMLTGAVQALADPRIDSSAAAVLTDLAFAATRRTT